MIYSDKGLALTKSFEGCKLESYKDSAGLWTIGYGHRAGVIEGMVWTQEQADQQLADDIQWANAVVNKDVTVDLNQNQHDALVDFCFNCGSGNFGESTLLRLVNLEKFQLASEQFGVWVYAGGQVIDGLVRRREAEAELFGEVPDASN